MKNVKLFSRFKKKTTKKTPFPNILGEFPPPEPHFSIILDLITSNPKEGVFRVPGSKNDVDELLIYLKQNKSETNDIVIRNYLKTFHVHSLCSTLKAYLASISLMCNNDEDWQSLNEAFSSKDLNKMKNYIENRVAVDRRRVLYRIIQLIEKLILVEATKMNVQNMAVVFAPSITEYKRKSETNSDPGAALIQHQKNLAVSVPMVVTLISEKDFLFQSLNISNRYKASFPGRSSNTPQISIEDDNFDKGENSTIAQTNEVAESEHESEIEGIKNFERVSNDEDDGIHDNLEYKTTSNYHNDDNDYTSYEDKYAYSDDEDDPRNIEAQAAHSSSQLEYTSTPRSTHSGFELVRNSLQAGTNSPTSQAAISLNRVKEGLLEQDTIKYIKPEPVIATKVSQTIEPQTSSTISSSPLSPLSPRNTRHTENYKTNIAYNHDDDFIIRASEIKEIVRNALRKEAKRICTDWDEDITELKDEIIKLKYKNEETSYQNEFLELKKEIENIRKQFSNFETVFKRLEVGQETLSLRIEEISKLNRSSNHSTNLSLERMRSELKENDLTLRELELQIDAMKMNIKSLSTPNVGLPRNFTTDPLQPVAVKPPTRTPPKPPTFASSDNHDIRSEHNESINHLQPSPRHDLPTRHTNSSTQNEQNSIENVEFQSSPMKSSNEKDPSYGKVNDEYTLKSTRSPITHLKLAQQLEHLQRKYLGRDKYSGRDNVQGRRNPLYTSHRTSNIYTSNIYSRRSSYLESYNRNSASLSPQSQTRPSSSNITSGTRSPSSFSLNVNQHITKPYGSNDLENSIQNLRKQLNFE